jgi:EAL domain-containing protein (putative c-di-GMP-specific phosphodiesterase class I)
MPSEINQSQVQPFMKLVEGLRSSNCQIALDNFSVSKQSLRLLKHAKPDCVRLSLPWVKGIEGNAKRELALGSFIRQLESKNIKVIAPCSFSADMRRLFALSGVSFCQERTRKTA